MNKRKAPTPHKPEMGVYINPLIDFGFKLLFGSAPNKELLIALLNSFLVGRKIITDLTFNKNERSGPISKSRKVIFDLTSHSSDLFLKSM